jgi:hypothetical protein
MFFRFAAALILVVLISMMGIWLEQETLRLRRAVSRQYYQTDLLLELHARLRLNTQQLTAPAQLRRLPIAEDSLVVKSNPRPATQPGVQKHEGETKPSRRLPLLKFQQPLLPDGID